MNVSVLTMGGDFYAQYMLLLFILQVHFKANTFVLLLLRRKQFECRTCTCCSHCCIGTDKEPEGFIITLQTHIFTSMKRVKIIQPQKHNQQSLEARAGIKAEEQLGSVRLYTGICPGYRLVTSVSRALTFLFSALTAHTYCLYSHTLKPQKF